MLNKTIDKNACITIITERIEDLRAIENFYWHFNIEYNKEHWKSKIGSLMIVLDYLRSL